MRVRITNPGTHSFDTKVTDAETGKPIGYVNDVQISIATSDPLPKAVITVVLPFLDVVADAEIKNVCAHCGRVIPIS